MQALLVDAPNEKVATIDREHREITQREAVVTQRVNESAGANRRATKMLIDMLKEAEQKAAATAPPPEEPAKLNRRIERSSSFSWPGAVARSRLKQPRRACSNGGLAISRGVSIRDNGVSVRDNTERLR